MLSPKFDWLYDVNCEGRRGKKSKITNVELTSYLYYVLWSIFSLNKEFHKRLYNLYLESNSWNCVLVFVKIQIKPQKDSLLHIVSIKGHVFWDGQEIWRNFTLSLDVKTKGDIFSNFVGFSENLNI